MALGHFFVTRFIVVFPVVILLRDLLCAPY
mgnify:CR=1 FL=1